MDTALAQRIIKARSGHGWSQAELAEVSGIAAAQISRYEQGKNTPRPNVIAKLAKALAVSFEWLAYGEGEIDDGSEVPTHPSHKKHVIELETDEQQRARLEAFAKSRGITYEMALNYLMQKLLAMADEEERLSATSATEGKKPDAS